MSSLIVTHPKLYLDTAHVINIARLRNGEAVPERDRDAYGKIDEYITQRHFGLIFNPGAPLEWLEGRATLESALQLAAVFDSAKLLYYLEPDSIIFTGELLRECCRIQPDLNAPALPPMQINELGKPFRSGPGVLADAVPGYLDNANLLPHLRDRPPPEIIEARPVSDLVRHAYRFTHDHPDICQVRIGGYGDALLGDIGRAYDGFERNLGLFRRWMKSFLQLDKVLRALDPGCDVEAILEAIDMERCPAVSLWHKARYARIKAGHDPRDNDVDDWAFLPAIPYADVVITDRPFCETIRQADRGLAERFVAKPDEAVQRLQKWLG